METPEVKEFLSGTLVTWFTSCIENPGSFTDYSDLVDGALLHSVYLQIDPNPLHNAIIASNGNVNLRIKNFEYILENVKRFYEERLGNILLKAPNATNLGKHPESHVEDMKLLLLLILGCAIQCPEKEKFITNIKNLHQNTQLELVEYIKQIIDYQGIVVSHEFLENANMGGLFTQVKNLIQERNYYYEKSQNLDFSDLEIQGNSTILISNCEDLSKSQLNSTSKSEIEEGHHCPELADLKIKFRKLKRDFEEKSELLSECKGEVEHNTILLSKLTQENHTLMMEARNAKSYRDELDAAFEKAQKVDHLEKQISRFREKLHDLEYYKTRTEELREDNKVLMETRETLEEELSSQSKKFAEIPELEAEILGLKKLLNDVTLERTADREKYDQLQEENIHLQSLVQSKNEASIIDSLNESDELVTMDNSLSDQLKGSAQAHTLKLELENRRLLSEIQSMKENSFQKDSPRILELEKDKKELQLKLDSLIKNNERLAKENSNMNSVARVEKLEKVEKELQLKIDYLTKNNERLTQRNTNLDFTCKMMKQENQNIKTDLEKLREEIADQITLESHHDKLSNDYVKRLQERDNYKAKLEDCKKRLAILDDSYRKLRTINHRLLNDRDCREKEIDSLRTLKKESVKLEEDFKSLFTTAEMWRAENEKLEKKNSKLTKKLNETLQENFLKGSTCLNLEFQIKNLNQRCQELFNMNAQAESEKRQLMDQLGDLMNQNKDLFMHTLEDKEYFHTEERKFKETINHMSTTNIKLEQKIMDFYKTMPTSTNTIKRHSMGSTFVKKIKKATSMLGLSHRSSGSWDDERKSSDVRSCDFDFQFPGNNFPPETNMTLDPRLLSGKKGLRDRLSLGFFGSRKSSAYSEDSESFTTPTTPDQCMAENLEYFKKEAVSKDTESISRSEQFNNSVFEAIPEIEDVISVKSDKQENIEYPNETEEEKDLEKYLKKPSKAESKTSLWLEYGCA